jgi:hypothetical protein
MDLQSNSAEAVDAGRGSRRRAGWKLGAWLAGAGLLALVLFLALHVKPLSQPRFVWMTPTELARAMRPGQLERLKYKLLRLLGPVANWLPPKRTLILVEAQLLTLTTEAARQTGLGSPLATNSVGQCAWALSAKELKGLRQRLQTLPGVAELGRPRVQTADGGQASISMGETVIIGGNRVPVGLTVNVLPKAAGISFRLLVDVASTEKAAAPGSEDSGIRTNFTVAFRALVPNGGAWVVAGGKPPAAEGTNYWFILSPVAVDATGNPVQRISNIIRR